MDTETRQLLPWYVNGTLTGADRDRVEAALRNEVHAASWLAWEKATQAAVKQDPAFDIADDRGLARTMQRVRATAVHKAPAAATQSWLARLTESFRWSPALAVACGLVAVQFAVITQLWSTKGEEAEYAAVRAMAARAHANDAYIRIVFKPESTEAELREAIRAIQAVIVSGPSQLGDYYVLLTKDASAKALAVLQGNTHIEAAEVIDALPARQ